jgi:hypothetical protein
MLFYLIVKYISWLWGIVPEEGAKVMFSVVSFFETGFEIVIIISAIAAFLPASEEYHQRTLKELQESGLFKNKKEEK